VTDMFAGVRVVEAGTWMFVPSAAAVLADFGAEVIKVEHPRRGDPQRGLETGGRGLVPSHLAMEQANRGKRSIGIDTSSPEGREVLYKLIESADVFMTNLLPSARRKNGVDVDQIQAIKPDIIYVRATSAGPKGPDAGKPGYDAATHWLRGGIAYTVTEPDALRPAKSRPGFGDKTGSMNIAFGVAAALFRRERTGEGAVVDTSLLSTAMWSLSSDITYSAYTNQEFSRIEQPISNPITYSYKTADNRWIGLLMIESDRWWPGLCQHLGRDDLITDERFKDATARYDNREACVQVLTDVFASATLDEWRTRFATLTAPWEPLQSPLELLDDPQVKANGFIRDHVVVTGETAKIVAAPVQFDEEVVKAVRAPELGENTEEILLELGTDWDEIIRLKELGAIN
jgi:crotonobetainyl-CoA:carnitine CoA-transferase CaiB-like acyl-CoA transferase